MLWLDGFGHGRSKHSASDDETRHTPCRGFSANIWRKVQKGQWHRVVHHHHAISHPVGISRSAFINTHIHSHLDAAYVENVFDFKNRTHM